jgi:hypothetical protein
MSITCSISASSSAMVTLSKLASTPMTWPTCYITTMWPRAKISRSASGRWKVKSAAKDGGPSKTYRTKALASIACDKRGIGVSRTGPLSMLSVDFDGSADMIESSEFGSVMVARPTRVCTIKMCKHSLAACRRTPCYGTRTRVSMRSRWRPRCDACGRDARACGRRGWNRCARQR